jgi:hypothetical protein
MNSKRENIMRNTFGIIDPITKKPYNDILKSFLIAMRIRRLDLIMRYILPSENSKDYYTLHVDKKVREIIKREGDCPCIVSFQTRQTSPHTVQLIAFARLFEEARTGTFYQRTTRS